MYFISTNLLKFMKDLTGGAVSNPKLLSFKAHDDHNLIVINKCSLVCHPPTEQQST